MAGKLAGLRRRLEKAEKALAETVEQEKLANCICKVGAKSRPTIVRSDRARGVRGGNEPEMSRSWIP